MTYAAIKFFRRISLTPMFFVIKSKHSKCVLYGLDLKNNCYCPVCPQSFTQKILKEIIKAVMSSEFNNLYEFADCRFDGKTGKLWRNNELILLSPKATELLNLLLISGGEYISKEKIFENIWKDTFVEDGVLTQNIYTLRKALGKNANGETLIENKTRLGYRITVPILLKNASKNANTEIQIKHDLVENVENAQFDKSSRRSFPVWLSAAFALILTAFVGFFIIHYFFSETTVTISKLEKVRFQKLTDTGNILTPSLSPDGNFIAYKKNNAIYIKDLTTSVETKPDFSNIKKFGHIRFSKDSEFLYLRNRASNLLPSDVMKVSRFGGEGKRIAENVWGSFSLSPDETKIAFPRSFPEENRQSLIVKNLANGEEKEIYKLISPQQFYLSSYPSWSSDGKKIVIFSIHQNQGFQNLIIIDADSGQTKELPFPNFRQVLQAVWLPKKDTLLVSASESKSYQLWEISLTDKKISRITNDLNNYLMPTISADGAKLLAAQYSFYANLVEVDAEIQTNQKQITFGNSDRDGYYGIDYLPNGEIVYSTNDGEKGETNLRSIDPATNTRHRLTENAGNQNENPIVSPDGKYIFFDSNRSKKKKIWRIDADGANPKQITFGEDSDDFFPQVSADGNEIYFIRKTANSSAVYKKSLTDNSELKITDEKTFTPINFIALSPDGKHLAFHHLTEKIKSEDVNQNYQIAVVETANAANVKFYSIGGKDKLAVYWTADSSSFDFTNDDGEQDTIFRQSITEEKPPQKLMTFDKNFVYFLSRSNNRKKFAISLGKQQNDAVLLTNFD